MDILYLLPIGDSESLHSILRLTQYSMLAVPDASETLLNSGVG